MARLPEPGKDKGTWGNILNEFLSTSLEPDGSLSAGAVGAGQLQAGAVTEAAIADNSVNSAHLKSASVATAHLQEGAVTASKLSGLDTATSALVLDGVSSTSAALSATYVSFRKLDGTPLTWKHVIITVTNDGTDIDNITVEAL